MEIISEGTHFRLVRDDELESILDILQQYLPEAIKVDTIAHFFKNIKKKLVKSFIKVIR